MDDYHSEPNVLSFSNSKYLHLSAAKYRAYRDGETADKETEALIDGRFLHMATIEKEKFERDYIGIVEPEWGHLRKTSTTSSDEAKENKTNRDQWRKENPDYNSPNNLGAKYEYYTRLSERVRRHPLVSALLECGEAEKEFRREIETIKGDKVTCKCRYDWIDEENSIGADFKFVADGKAHPDEFWWMLKKFRYYAQQAFYCKIKPVDTFYFVVVEKSYPHDMAVYKIPRDLDLLGDEEVERDLQLYADCKRTGKWPGYSAGVMELMHPTERKKELERKRLNNGK